MTGDEVAHAHGELTHADEHEHEEVTAPDQYRRTVSPRLARLGAVLTIILLPLMAFVGNHRGNVEKVFLVSIAGFIALMLILDVVLRRSGLRS